MFTILIQCLAAVHICGELPPPRTTVVYATYRQCDVAVKGEAKKLNPGRGAYAFRCVAR